MPGCGIVTPFNSSAICIANLLWLIKINCTSSARSEIKLVNLITLASSRGASTSSNTQNGAGCCLKIANIRLNAVKVFSPPDSTANRLFFLPLGCAINSKPARHCSLCSKPSSLLKVRLAWPPPKTLVNKLVNDSFTESKVSKNSVLVLASMEAIASVSVTILAVISFICCSKGNRRSSTAANSAAAAKFTGPILFNLALSCRSSLCSFCSLTSDRLRP